MRLNRMIFLLLVIALSLQSTGVLAQQADSLPAVHVLARPLEKSILLRWAPGTSMAWKLGNRYGYQLERFTIMRDGKTLNQPERKLLSLQPIKPLPLDDWEPLVEKDNYAAVAAQAIYGETFEMEGASGNGVMQIYQQVQEQDLRHSFALFSADMSRTVARASGLFFEDITVQANETYLYRVSSLVPAEQYPVLPGDVLTSTEDYEPLPQPVGLTADFDDKMVLLRWDQEALKTFYNAYWLERSADGGKSFQRLSDEPLVQPVPENRRMPRYMTFVDSLPQNGVEYQYRIIGQSAFGELGPASEVVTGRGAGRIRSAPHIIEKYTPDNQRVELSWLYEGPDSLNLASFALERAPAANGVYQRLYEGGKASRFTDKEPGITNYYRVLAFDQGGQYIASPPVLVQLVDSIPPAAPAGLKASIDTSGVLSLQWAPNSDPDIFGYRIYRANNLQEEFSQLTSAPVAQNRFTDTLKLNTLSKKVYYKVMAIDLRQNHSELSAALEVKKPDRVPPVSPVFKEVSSSPEGIQLEWISSSSEDAVKHLLYRTPDHENSWQLIAAFDRWGLTGSYLDISTEPGISYRYTLVAVDGDSLESAPARLVRGQRTDTGLRPPVHNLKAKVNRSEKTVSLSWQYAAAGVEKYQIYRAEGEEKLQLYATFEVPANSWQDSRLKPGIAYQYKVMAIYRDGGVGVSENIKLTY